MLEIIEPNLPDLFKVHVMNDIDDSEFTNDIAFLDEMIEIYANPPQVLGL